MLLLLKILNRNDYNITINVQAEIKEPLFKVHCTKNEVFHHGFLQQM